MVGLILVGVAYGEDQKNQKANQIKEEHSALPKTKLSGNISIKTPVDMFIKNVTARPCDVAYAEIDFGKDAPPVVIVVGLGNPDKWNLYPWSFFEFNKNKWVEPKTQEPDGTICKYGCVDFDHTNAGNVYVEKFKKKGILSYNEELRFGDFTYLDPSDNILKTVHFLKPSQVGMQEGDLIKLRDSGRLHVRHRILK